MGLAYFSQDDVHMRLHNTVCRYEKLPVLVKVSMHDLVNHIYISSCGNNPVFRDKKIVTTDPAFVHRSPELGYVNMKFNRVTDAFYLVRDPQRKQQQGLSFNNVHVLEAHGPSFGDIINASGFHMMMVNVYPKYEDALKQVEEGDVKGVAFHKHACLRRVDGVNISLVLKGRTVAFYSDRHRVFVPMPGIRDGSYLQQFFNRLGVPL